MNSYRDGNEGPAKLDNHDVQTGADTACSASNNLRGGTFTLPSVDWWTKVRATGSTLHEINTLVASPFFGWLFDLSLRILFGVSVLVLIMCVLAVSLMSSLALKLSSSGDDIRTSAIKRFQRGAFSFLHDSVMDICEWICGQRLEIPLRAHGSALVAFAPRTNDGCTTVFDPNTFRLKFLAKSLKRKTRRGNGAALKLEEVQRPDEFTIGVSEEPGGSKE